MRQKCSRKLDNSHDQYFPERGKKFNTQRQWDHPYWRDTMISSESEELVTELHTRLGTVEQERDEFRNGLKSFAKQFKKAKKSLLKRLKKETSKAKRKVLKQDLRKVELAYQSIR